MRLLTRVYGNYVIMHTELYGTINNINKGAQNNLHTLCVSCDGPPTKQQCSRGADLLTLSEYRMNST